MLDILSRLNNMDEPKTAKKTKQQSTVVTENSDLVNVLSKMTLLESTEPNQLRGDETVDSDGAIDQFVGEKAGTRYYYGKKPLTKEQIYTAGYIHGKKNLDKDDELRTKYKNLYHFYETGYNDGLYGYERKMKPVYEEDDFDVNQFADEYEDDSDVGMLDDDDLELLNDSEEDFDVNKFADEYEDDAEVGNLEDDDLELLKDWDNEEDFDVNRYADEYEDDEELGMLDDDDVELLKDWDEEEDFDLNAFADEYEDESEVGNLEDEDLDLLKDWDEEEPEVDVNQFADEYEDDDQVGQLGDEDLKFIRDSIGYGDIDESALDKISSLISPRASAARYAQVAKHMNSEMSKDDRHPAEYHAQHVAKIYKNIDQDKLLDVYSKLYGNKKLNDSVEEEDDFRSMVKKINEYESQPEMYSNERSDGLADYDEEGEDHSEHYASAFADEDEKLTDAESKTGWTTTGDRYDGGLQYVIYHNGKKVYQSDFIDGEQDMEYKGQKYDNYKSFISAIAKDKGIDPNQILKNKLAKPLNDSVDVDNFVDNYDETDDFDEKFFDTFDNEEEETPMGSSDWFRSMMKKLDNE